MSRPATTPSRLTRLFALLFITIVAFSGLTAATSSSDDATIETTDSEGNTVYLSDDRRPALYTGDFGDCLGDSVINVTRFDGAYYADNLTIAWHLEGMTALTNESVMMTITVFAYGQNHYELTFNPCNANIDSMCPLNASIPIQAEAIIPVSASEVSALQGIALHIPDFEGQVIMRMFSNVTESEIACYTAKLTNGATFSHPTAVGSVLGAFAVIALISSFLVAIHGDSVPETRKHHAHSISVFVVFAVYQHIFFTGALSMNWPSVLVAFWSNYAWSAGMIFSSSMQTSINNFIGQNQGNISMVGAAASGTESSSSVGGGYSIEQIYKRGLPKLDLTPPSRQIGQFLSKRDDIANRSTGFDWYGNPTRPGLPLPGNFSGFAGTLGEEDIAVSDAFLTSLIWFVVLLGCLVAAIALFKGAIELLSKTRVLKAERLSYFRRHWLMFMAAAVLRAMFIAFFMFILLTIFQFDFGGSAGVMAIAGVVFALFVLLMFGATAFAFYSQWRAGKLIMGSDKLRFERRKVMGFMPWFGVVRESSLGEKDEGRAFFGSLPWYGLRSAQREDGYLAHDDDRFTHRFGWLSSRYRDSRWWFPAVWLIYEFIRACFYGAAADHAFTQVYGLLAVEIIAFVLFVWMKPFESTRLNVVMVYLLGFSKILTVALASFFDVKYDQDRIICAVIGIVIIVIQGLLTICLMIAITLGAISSYMSLTRNHPTETFHPRRWRDYRGSYFRHVDFRATDRPRPPPPPPPPAPPVPTEPYFKVGSVRRELKIEDENEIMRYRNGSDASLPDENEQMITPTRGPSRAQSIRSHVSGDQLPYGARRHRASWSTRDFEEMRSGMTTPHHQGSNESLRNTAMRQRAATMKSSVPPRFDTPTRQIRSSSLRGPAPAISYDLPRQGTPDLPRTNTPDHRRRRSSTLHRRHDIHEEEGDFKEVRS